MATLYNCLKLNKSILAVKLDCKSILCHFKFTDETACLKTAIEKSIEECLATDVVDSLLTCNESVIDEFIKVLHSTNQSHLINLFEMIVDNADTALQLYQNMVQCSLPISPEIKLYLQLNYKQICDILKRSNICVELASWLNDKQAISNHMFCKCTFAYINKGNVTTLLDMIISGNAYQYTCFKEYAKNNCPDLFTILVKQKKLNV